MGERVGGAAWAWQDQGYAGEVLIKVRGGGLVISETDEGYSKGRGCFFVGIEPPAGGATSLLCST